MLALMLYTSYEISVSISIECGLLFHYCSMGVWRCLSVHNRQLDPHFFMPVWLLVNARSLNELIY